MGINFVENYENMSDDDIVALINGENYELLQVIIDRYYPIILTYVRKYCPHIYYEDAIQESLLALYSAVRGFDSSKSTFKAFAVVCIKRAVISVLRKSLRKGQIPDELVSSIEDIEIVDSNSPEKIFFEQEALKNLTNTIRLELSELEYSVLEAYLEGEKYSDIARKLNITEKSVNNALVRIRKKLRN